MAKPLPSKSDPTPEPPRRRQSDLTGTSAGVGEGGRRQSDRVYVAPKNRKATIAIWCSFLFSFTLIAWTFSVPFRGGGVRELNDVPEAEKVHLEYEARLSAEEYMRYTDRLEEDLQQEYRKKAARPKNPGPSKTEIKNRWAEGIEKREKQLEAMKAELKDEKILKGTIEWQNQKELEALAQDAPQDDE